MTKAILLVVAIWALAVFVTGLLPWMSRVTAVYALHEVRDRLYEMRDRVPGAKETRVYRLLEFISTAAIHCVREQPITTALSIANLVIRDPDRKRKGRTDPEIERELREVFGARIAKSELETVLRKFDWIPFWVSWRMIWSHPLALLLVPVAIVLAIVDRGQRSKPTPEKIARAKRMASLWPKAIDDEGQGRSGLTSALA